MKYLIPLLILAGIVILFICNDPQENITNYYADQAHYYEHMAEEAEMNYHLQLDFGTGEKAREYKKEAEEYRQLEEFYRKKEGL